METAPVLALRAGAGEFPLSWEKLHGGDCVRWIGYELDIRKFEKGVSESKVRWASDWIEKRPGDGTAGQGFKIGSREGGVRSRSAAACATLLGTIVCLVSGPEGRDLREDAGCSGYLVTVHQETDHGRADDGRKGGGSRPSGCLSH